MRKLLTLITAASIAASAASGITVSAFDLGRVSFFDTPPISASASPSPSVSPSPSALPSPSAAADPSQPPAQSASPAASETASPTTAVSESPTPEASAAPSMSPSPSPSPTPSAGSTVTGITFNKKELELSVGESFELNAVFEPETAVPGKLTWFTSDPCVTVNNGVITAAASGSAVIMAVEETSGLAASCYVTVKEESGLLDLSITEGVKQVTVEKNGVTSEVIAGSNRLEAGEYTVKAVSEEGYTLEPYSETLSIKAGETASLSVSASKTSCIITLPQVTGCTITPTEGSVSPVAAGGSYSFTVTTGASFNTENMVIKANGEPIEAVNGVYTITDIREDITISIDGVEVMSWDTSLKSVKVLGIDAVLENDVYSVSVPYGAAITTGDIAVETTDENANYTVTTEDGKFTITVTAEDGTKKAYTLNVTEKEKTAVDDAVLSIRKLKFDDAAQSSDGSYASQDEVRADVEEKIKDAAGSGMTVTVVNGDKTEPVRGTLSSPDGTDGAYEYNVTISDGTETREITVSVVINAYDYSISSSDITATSTTITIKNLSSSTTAALYNENGSIVRRWTSPEGGRVTFRNLEPGYMYVVKLRDENSTEVPSSGTSVRTQGSSSSNKSTRYYTVTFDEGNHGEIVSGKTKQSVRLARAPEFPEVEADEGYIFKGWSSNGVLVEDPDKVQIRSTTEFTAIYEESSGSSYGTSINRPSSDDNIQDTPQQPTVTSYYDVLPSDWFYSSVMSVSQKGYMNGTGPNMFQPDLTLTRAMLVTILYRYAGEPEAEGVSFNDVPLNTWYTDAVTWAADAAIVNGIAPGIFDPNSNITREQLATIMYRYAEAFGYDTSAAGSIIAFRDSAYISDWAQTALIWTIGAGIIGGRDDNTLDPGGFATRAEAAAIIERFENYIG